MPWFKVDDAFHSHPKVMELSVEAVGLWTLAGTWCANYLTDGTIKESVLHRFGRTSANVRELCAELVASGLWIDNGDGTYTYKDWAEYQPMKDAVEAEREAARERMRLVRAKKSRSGDVRANKPRSSEEVRVTPTRPDPVVPNGTTERARKRATALPDGWMPDEHVRQAMAQEHPDVDLQREHAKFTDHWRSQPGAKGRKTDWNATWRNWIRRAAEYATPRGYSTPDQRRAENVHRISQHNPWTPDQPTPDQWGEGVRALGR